MAFNLISYWEHYKNHLNETESENLERLSYSHDFKKRRGQEPCYKLVKTDAGFHLTLSYFVGVAWVVENKTALYVAPKLNTRHEQSSEIVAVRETDYVKMLFDALKDPEVGKYGDQLFELEWHLPKIEISQKQDLLTPLLVIQFLSLVREIVRKGLKKSYYTVEQNIHGRVKGKILVGKTLTRNVFRNKKLNSYCGIEEFGLNGFENRLLKKTLGFVQRFLPVYNNIKPNDFAVNLFNYITPAFETISDQVNLNEIKSTIANVFYQEYEKAIQLAKLILRRFGYNISNTEATTISTPPFWIDMSKLFELYVLRLLKDRFTRPGAIRYQFSSYWNELDYLITGDGYKIVADAKYKVQYQHKFENKDIRQVSGYARLKTVYNELKIPINEIIDCLIIYPDQEKGLKDLAAVDFTDEANRIGQFVQVYKVAVKLPIV